MLFMDRDFTQMSITDIADQQTLPPTSASLSLASSLPAWLMAQM
jgi:hypothetical protein